MAGAARAGQPRLVSAMTAQPSRELRFVTRDGDRVRIGALNHHRDLAEHPLIRTDVPLLSETAEQIGDPQIRNRGTIGGSIAHADPAGEWLGNMASCQRCLTLTQRSFDLADRTERGDLPAIALPDSSTSARSPRSSPSTRMKPSPPGSAWNGPPATTATDSRSRASPGRSSSLVRAPYLESGGS
jgi:FAD binding domain in molybdopterin dehydrogenase